MKHFRVKPGERMRLDDIDPHYKAARDKEAAADEISHYAERLRELQYLLYAEHRRSLLICLQALDAGGKDGTIRHVLGYMNPQSCRVQAFKAPTPEEAEHDFLWRIYKVVPRVGEVVIFNRSHYEDVLIARVQELVPKSVWSERYDVINAFEKHLSDSGTHILKFFLHISPEEQLRRFKKRLDDPTRQWKISEADYAERPYWDDYTKAFEDALSRCSTDHAPWFVVPANHKWSRNLIVSRIVVKYLESLDMQFPKPTVDLTDIAAKYHAAVTSSKEKDND
ncbi:Polyphosphate kinase 2 (PPK2) [Bremerella volcania]|uniref:Polyphosphate kinase 2 (PPK2) n=1 Tax=Bremerella volcania TaxID=2527984 RepID=A0A518C5U5_9BACT|nr:polyphosphate kinase 2 family protein [Bremerella volcania]QDU74582.1 Polyphosphate kinase 2 (PPK2) [Bremerella volcania]